MKDQKAEIQHVNERTIDELVRSSAAARMLHKFFGEVIDDQLWEPVPGLNDIEVDRISNALSRLQGSLIDLDDAIDYALSVWERASERIVDANDVVVDDMYGWQLDNTAHECRRAGVPLELGLRIEDLIEDSVNTYRPDLTWMEAKVLIADAIWKNRL